MSDATFVGRSRAAFAKHFPEITARIEKGSSVESSVVTEDGEPVDICVEGKPVYGGDARRFAAGQVEAFMRKPLRFFVQRLDLSGIVTGVGLRLMHTIDKGLRKNDFGACSTQPKDHPTFLIVFGLGLGHHLKQLTQETAARWLIIVEPLIEFFEHSFHVVDWEALVDNFKSKGGSVHIFTEIDPRQIVTKISGVVSTKGVPYADGSWVFTHYPLWAFTEARDKLHEAMEFVFINRGFFEDELVMMRNSVANCARHDFWLFESRRRLRRTETAAIVGAGPSLDESMETLHRIRDRVLLFSAGTALRPLLLNGIVPDFHCEIENGTAVWDVLNETAKHGDLSKITLIASTTVDPRVPTLFRETIFYFRDSVSPTQILMREHRPVYGTSPTCANLAITIAGQMGIIDVVLFGTDCGVRPGSLRHAKGTVYSDIDQYEKSNRTEGQTMEVEGNFGGVVYTDLIYDSCRVMLESGVRHFGLRALNCSDGALIAGARPCVPEALEIAADVVDRAGFRSALEATMRRYAPGELLEEADLGAVRRHTEEMFAALDKLLIELGDGEPDFAAVYDRVMDFASKAKDRYGYTESIIAGSLQALPRIAMFYGFRVVEAVGRKKLFDLFIAEFRAINADMAKQIYALFDGLETQVLSSPELIAANAG